MIIQFCGLPGSGKTAIANNVKGILENNNISIEVLDADEYRKTLCADLGFSKKDRNENIRRLASVANEFANYKAIVIVCAINPYQEIREEVNSRYKDVMTIYIECSLKKLVQRDPKGLYKKALLPDDHPEKILNFTGISDPFEIPLKPDLIINTDTQSLDESSEKLYQFILLNLKSMDLS